MGTVQSAPEIHVIMTSLTNDEKYPILDIGCRRGKTDYIDFIQSEEVTAPIMRGVDCHGRKFLVIRGHCKIGDTENITPMFGTYFQRYTDTNGVWVGGGVIVPDDHRNHDLLTTFGGMQLAQAQLLEKLCKEGYATLQFADFCNLRVNKYHLCSYAAAAAVYDDISHDTKDDQQDVKLTITII